MFTYYVSHQEAVTEFARRWIQLKLDLLILLDPTNYTYQSIVTGH